MEKIVIFISCVWLLSLLYEKRKLERHKKSFSYIVHVNGIRGKSTVSRLIDAGMRANGYRVFTKTTGTAPRIINVKGEEKELLRRGKANIREQIRLIEWAYREKAEILILECMAVNPEYQFVCEHRIVNSNLAVITNVRRDHLDEMGDSLEEIAESLSNTIPKQGRFFTSDRKFFPFFEKKCQEKQSKAILAKEEKEEYWEIDFPANVALALEVCKSIGIPEKIALEGMKHYKRDPGRFKILHYVNKKQQDIYFVNALAANDPDSTKIILERVFRKNAWKHQKYLLVNNRADRLSRTKQYIDFVQEEEQHFDKILIYGESKELFQSYLERENIAKNKIVLVKDQEYFEKIENSAFIIAVGNICGYGKELIEFIEEKGEEVNA